VVLCLASDPRSAGNLASSDFLEYSLVLARRGWAALEGFDRRSIEGMPEMSKTRLSPVPMKRGGIHPKELS